MASRIRACLLLLSLGSPASLAAAELSEVAQIKAAIVFNLTRVVIWPEAVTGGKSINLDVAGEGPECQALLALEGKTVRNKPLHVRPWRGDVGGQVLFVASSEAARWPALRESLAGQAVLTVSELDHFCENGGIVQLVRRQDKINMRINRRAASAAGLQLSSQLLKVAELVGEAD
jgi:hypothetical protein